MVTASQHCDQYLVSIIYKVDTHVRYSQYLFVTCKIPLASGVGITEITIRLFQKRRLQACFVSPDMRPFMGQVVFPSKPLLSASQPKQIAFCDWSCSVSEEWFQTWSSLTGLSGENERNPSATPRCLDKMADINSDCQCACTHPYRFSQHDMMDGFSQTFFYKCSEQLTLI